MLIPDRISWVADRLKAGRRVNRVTVRDFLGYFGAERRGSIKVQAIREILDALDLTTEPDFELAWIDGPIWLRLKDGARTTATSSTIAEGNTVDIELEGASATPPHVSDLAEPPLTSTAPDTPTRSDIVDGISAEDPTFRIGS
jgi:hypothetical protein